MSGAVLSLKKEPYSNEQLEGLIGRTFYKKRFGISTKVKLVGVKARMVKLTEDDRADSFTVSIAEFNKFYTLLS